MKTLLMTVLLMVSGSAFALDACLTGAFHDKERVGEGIQMEFLNDKISAGFFYTFVDKRPMWYVMSGEEVITLYQVQIVEDDGIDFITKETAVGVASVEFITDNAVLWEFVILQEFDYDKGRFTLCKGDHCTGSYLYSRITQPIGCQ